MKVLCVTHSSRPFFEPRCALNALEGRFRPDRLANLPPFESLEPVSKAVPHTGSVTFWETRGNAGTLELRFLRHYDPGFKVQTVAFVGERLAVYGADRLQILTPGFDVERTIRHPHLAGGHTVYPDPMSENEVWASSAPANAIFKLNIKNGKIVERRDVPAVYGRGYPIAADTDLHAHFIPTDLQPAHVNSAIPCGNDLLLTLWIPGVAGFLGPAGEWREVVSGFRGCHGARIVGKDELMLTDSAAGLVWFLDAETGAIRRRLDFHSRWLHDAECLGDGVIAGSACDINVLRLVKADTGAIVVEQDCRLFGNAVMFVNACDAPNSWGATLTDAERHVPAEVPAGNALGENIFAGEVAQLAHGAAARGGTLKWKEGGRSVHFLRAGRYILGGTATCGAGRLKVSLLDADSQENLAFLTFSPAAWEERTAFELNRWRRARLLIAIEGEDGDFDSDCRIEDLFLRRDLSKSGVANTAPEENLAAEFFVPYPYPKQADSLVTFKTMNFRSLAPTRSDYMYQGPLVSLPAGMFALGGRAACRAGAVTAGLVDEKKNEWVAQTPFDGDQLTSCTVFSLPKQTSLRFIVSSANHRPAPVEVAFEDIFLYRLE